MIKKRKKEENLRKIARLLETSEDDASKSDDMSVDSHEEEEEGEAEKEKYFEGPFQTKPIVGGAEEEEEEDQPVKVCPPSFRRDGTSYLLSSKDSWCAEQRCVIVISKTSPIVSGWIRDFEDTGQPTNFVIVCEKKKNCDHVGYFAELVTDYILSSGDEFIGHVTESITQTLPFKVDVKYEMDFDEAVRLGIKLATHNLTGSTSPLFSFDSGFKVWSFNTSESAVSRFASEPDNLAIEEVSAYAKQREVWDEFMFFDEKSFRKKQLADKDKTFVIENVLNKLKKIHAGAEAIILERTHYISKELTFEQCSGEHGSCIRAGLRDLCDGRVFCNWHRAQFNKCAPPNPVL